MALCHRGLSSRKAYKMEKPPGINSMQGKSSGNLWLNPERTLALEVKGSQSLSTNSAAFKVSLQNHQPLNSICVFLFYCRASQVPTVASVIPELSQVSSSEKFITYLTPTLEQKLETIHPHILQEAQSGSAGDVFCHTYRIWLRLKCHGSFQNLAEKELPTFISMYMYVYRRLCFRSFNKIYSLYLILLMLVSLFPSC